MNVNTGLRSAVGAVVVLAATAGVGQFTGVIAAPGGTAVNDPRPAASARPQHFQHYVALGDSYTSGPLIQRMRTDPLGCGRSTNNYPALLARQLQVRTVTDASCGGAGTEELTSPQHTLSGTNPPQFDALSSRTNLVTIGIGGNDEGAFSSLLQTCERLRGTDPKGSPCARHFTAGGTDDLKARIARTADRVAAALHGIAERAPAARTLVIGYPRIVPQTGSCQDILPFAIADYRYIDSVTLALNDALSSAAVRGNATYVDTYAPSLGHDGCAGEGAAWINGTDTKPFAALRFHPYATAMSAEAAIIADVLRAGQRPAGTAARQPVAPTASDEQTATMAKRFTGATDTIPAGARPEPAG